MNQALDREHTMKSHLTGETPLLSPRDVNFLLYEWLDVESLCKRQRFAEHSAGTFDAVLDLAADIAAGLFAPHNKLADSVEITVGPDGRIQTIPDTRKALDALSAAGDPETTLANSTAYLESVGHVVLAWIWLEQALAAEGKTGDFYDGKRAAARYFFTYELPKTAAQFDLLASLDRSMLELSESWF